MAANDWFCQFLADILGIAVERPANLETTALGAAMLAAHAAGAWSGALDGAAGLSEVTRFTPQLPVGDRARLTEEWQVAVRRATLR